MAKDYAGIWDRIVPWEGEYAQNTIIVLDDDVPDTGQGPGVHWHEEGDVTGYGWMALDYLLSEHQKREQ